MHKHLEKSRTTRTRTSLIVRLPSDELDYAVVMPSKVRRDNEQMQEQMQEQIRPRKALHSLGEPCPTNHFSRTSHLLINIS